MLRSFIGWLLVVGLVGCEADPIALPDGAGGGPDVSDGFVASDGLDRPDALPIADADLDSAPDARPRDATPPDPDVAVDAEPDVFIPPGEEVDPPPFEQVAVTRRGAETLFFWVDADGHLVRLVADAEGRAPAAPTVIEQPPVVPDRVVARDVAGHPWVAYGAAGAPVVLFQGDLPALTRVELALYGAPALAAVDNGVLVVARDAEGNLAWQRVGNDLELGPLTVDPFGLDRPDDVAGVPAGVVLYFAEAGQCLQIDSRDWQPSGNFPCPTAGRLISDGRRALVVRTGSFGVAEIIEVVPLYDDDADYLISYRALESGLFFGDDGDQRPVVGERLFPGNQIRRGALSFVGPTETWDSAETWLDGVSTPFGANRTRAFARRTLPARAVDVGLCETGLHCDTDAACNGGVCTPTRVETFGLALDFTIDARPRVRLYPLIRRNVLDPPYGIDPNRGCVPEVERCDGQDQDCDGLVDDGRCCRVMADEVSYRWATGRPIARIEVDGVEQYEMLMADTEANNSYQLYYRLADTTRWEGKGFTLRQDPFGVPGNTGVAFEGAIHGRTVLVAGAVVGLIARQVDDDGEPGGWALFMSHPSRNAPDEQPPRPVVPIDCERILAADVLGHLSPADGQPQGEQFAIVCSDKIVHIYAILPDADRTHLLRGLDIAPADWATIHRSGESELQILIGSDVPGAGWTVRSLEMRADDDDPPDDALDPEPILTSRAIDLQWPVYRHPVAGRPPVQIRDGRFARVGFPGPDGGDGRTEWRDALLAPDPRTTVFSPRRFRVFAAGPYPHEAPFQEATGWWAADLTGNGGFYNLWSTEPVFVVQGPMAYWYATRGSYGLDDQFVNTGRADVAIITPTDLSDARWRMITRQTNCTRP